MDEHEQGHAHGSMVDAPVPMGHHLDDVGRRRSVSIPWRSPTVQVVLASTLLAPLGIALISPGLPVIQERFALTDEQVSLVLSSYFVTGIVLSPVIGVLEDRVGRRTVLLPSLVGFSLTGAAIALAPSFAVVIALRVVQGTAAAGMFITTVTVIGDTFTGEQRSAVLGMNTAALSGAAAVLPTVGGVLATWAWNAPFVAYGLGFPVALFAYRALEEPRVAHAARGLGSVREALGALTLRESALLYGSAFTIEILLFGAVFTTLPFLLSEEYGVTPVGIGFVVTAALAASAVAASQAGRLARRLSDETLIVLGFASVGVGLVGAWGVDSPALIGVTSVVFGAGWGVTLPSIDDEVSEFVPRDLRAEALSVRNSTTFLGRTTAPLLFTWLATTWEYQTLLLAAGVAGFLAGLVGMVLSRWPVTTDAPSG